MAEPLDLESPFAREDEADADRIKKKREAERFAEDLRNVVATEGGRRVLWRIMDDAGIFAAGGNQGAHATAIYIREMVKKLSPHYWHLMVKENDL